jgi:hypothetical protein
MERPTIGGAFAAQPILDPSKVKVLKVNSRGISSD